MKTAIRSALSPANRALCLFVRMPVCFLIAAAIYCAFAVTPASATTYYLDANDGNDSNPGTSEQPWKTINRACFNTKYAGVGADPLVAAGDTVILRTGEYGQWKWFDISEPNSWITYRADTGAIPHFWEIILGASLGEQKNMYVVIDGMNITWTGHTSAEIYLVKFTGANYIKLQNSYLEGLVYPDTGRGIYIAGISYTQLAKYIEINNCEVNNCGTGITGSYVGNPIGEAENGLIIKNCKIHHIYDDAIAFSAMCNSTIKDNQIYDLSCLNASVILYDVNDTISGTFTVGETAIQGVVSGVVRAQLTSGGHQKIFVDSNDLSSAWRAGQQVAGQSSGVTFTPSSCTESSHADAVQLFAPVPRIQTLKNVTIQRNLIHDTRGQGIFLKQMENVLIENNLIYGEFLATSICVSGESISGTIRNNTVCKTVSTAADIDVESNIYAWAAGQSYRQGWNVLSGGNPYRCIVAHTSSVDNQPPNETYWMTIPVLTFNVHNNLTARAIIYNAAFGQVLNEGNNICGLFSFLTVPGPNSTDCQYGHYPLTEPEIAALFVDPQNNDYRLKADSKAINFGNPNFGPASDILGVSRNFPPDAGCYEYVGSVPPPSGDSPNADAGPDQTLTDTDLNGSEQVTLDGSGSNDPDGSIVSYVWTEGGSQIATNVGPTVSLPIGQHTITLQVTDNDGLTDTDMVIIKVGSVPVLVGHWKFDEGTGTIADDSSGNGAAGYLINGPTWTTQGEISFDGSDDAVEISTANLNAGGGTVALWAYPGAFSKSRHFLFGHILSGSNRIQLYCNALGTLGVGLGDNAGLSTNIQTLNAHEWYHIALVWNGTNYVVYVDGVQKATGTYSGLSGLQTYADIGNNGNRSGRTEGFDGFIDEVRLYDKPLAASEIADLALMFLPIGDKTAVEGEELRFSIRAKSGSIVELSDQNLPSLSSFASNVFSWTPDYDDAGTYELEFTAPHDSGEDFEKVAVTIMDAQQAEPVGHWQFDELSDDIIAYDASASNNTGYLRNGLAWGSGKINGAIVFSVPNDAVEIQTTNFDTKTGTIAMWVYVERQTLSRHYLFGHTTESMANRIQLYLKYGNLCLGLGNSHETHTNIQRLQNQKWYHIALTWSPTTYSVYVDGLLKASGVYPGLTGLAGHADIGNNGASRDKALNGKIDDVRIYDRVLGAAEIAQLAVGD